MTVLLTGFLTCLVLIVAIGPQSAWLLRQGLRRDRIGLAIACCALSDVVLVGLGTAGVGAVLDHAPWLLDVILWLGVVYLLWFASHAFRSARQPAAGPAHHETPVDHLLTSEIRLDEPVRARGTTVATRDMPQSTVGSVVGAGLAVSIANPHAWVDTLVVLGGMANSFGSARWLFAAGAISGSLCWFMMLGIGGRTLGPWLNRPRTSQMIDGAVGVTMLVVAAFLAFGQL